MSPHSRMAFPIDYSTRRVNKCAGGQHNVVMHVDKPWRYDGRTNRSGSMAVVQPAFFRQNLLTSS